MLVYSQIKNKRANWFIMNPKIVSLRKIRTLFLLSIILMLVYAAPSNAELFMKHNGEKDESNEIEVMSNNPFDFSDTITEQTLDPIDPIETRTFESSDIPIGITWLNDTVIYNPDQMETPSIAVDSNDLTHICWSIHDGGASCNVRDLYENGTVNTLLIEL